MSLMQKRRYGLLNFPFYITIFEVIKCYKTFGFGKL